VVCLRCHDERRCIDYKEIVELAFRKHETNEGMTSHCIAEKYKYQSAVSPGNANALIYISGAKEQENGMVR
jgi:hypothetical protein